MFSYGPMGVSVIVSTLQQMFSNNPDSQEELDSTLDCLITTVLQDENREGKLWDDAAPGMCSMPFKYFIDYVLLPHAAMILIQADLGVNEVDAAKAYRSSQEYGNTFFDDVDDQMIDDIAQKNFMGSSKSLNTVSPVFSIFQLIDLPNTYISLQKFGVRW